jgi:hypothetical protein
MDATLQTHRGFHVWLLGPCLLQRFSFLFSRLLSVEPFGFERLVPTCPAWFDGKIRMGVPDQKDTRYSRLEMQFFLHRRRRTTKSVRRECKLFQVCCGSPPSVFGNYDFCRLIPGTTKERDAPAEDVVVYGYKQVAEGVCNGIKLYPTELT